MNTTALNDLRDELAHRNQRGITFITAAVVYWLVVGIRSSDYPMRPGWHSAPFYCRLRIVGILT